MYTHILLATFSCNVLSTNSHTYVFVANSRYLSTALPAANSRYPLHHCCCCWYHCCCWCHCCCCCWCNCNCCWYSWFHCSDRLNTSALLLEPPFRPLLCLPPFGIVPPFGSQPPPFPVSPLWLTAACGFCLGPVVRRKLAATEPRVFSPGARPSQ